MSKILLIGSRSNTKNPVKTGGVTVLFELLLEELREKNVNFDVIDTLKENYRNSVVAYLSVVLKLIKLINKFDHISLQATANSFVYIGPIMIFLSKIFNKKTSVRKFAGNFDQIHRSSGFIKKRMIEYVLNNADVVFFETKYLVEYFRQFNSNTHWFPNVRKQRLKPKLPRQYRKRFVFIGTVIEEKGIEEICAVANNLPDDFVIDIYGPIYDSKYTTEYFESRRISYKGALLANKVPSVLNQYDVLLLPSYREGYPGIIIEAFALGIPAIATKLEGISEMIEDEKNGLLIDIKNKTQLRSAMLSINDEIYQDLSEGAKKSFMNFDSKEQTMKFLKTIGGING